MSRSLSCFYLKAIIGPATKLHHASLLVKREVFHIHLGKIFRHLPLLINTDLTGGVVDCRRFPLNSSVKVKSRFGGQSYLKITISAENGGSSLSSFSLKQIITCCKVRCQAARCGWREHGGSQLLENIKQIQPPLYSIQCNLLMASICKQI